MMNTKQDQNQRIEIIKKIHRQMRNMTLTKSINTQGMNYYLHRKKKNEYMKEYISKTYFSDIMYLLLARLV